MSFNLSDQNFVHWLLMSPAVNLPAFPATDYTDLGNTIMDLIECGMISIDSMKSDGTIRFVHCTKGFI